MNLKINAFLNCQKGNIAIMSAFAAIPVMTAVAGTFDYSRTAKVQTAMQRAADSAVLAAIERKNLKWPARQRLANRMFMTNVNNNVSPRQLTGRLSGRKLQDGVAVRFDASATVPTLLGGFSSAFSGKIIVSSAAIASKKTRYQPVLVDAQVVARSRTKERSKTGR